MGSVSVRAFAKINLGLRVGPPRPDGFHEVRTVLQTIDLADRLTCTARRGPFEIRCAAPGVPTDRRNLIWKAAERLWSAAGRRGRPRNVVVTLRKAIPAQAGLGGGSSDAAAALVALRRLWKLDLDDRALHRLAARLGSDVPFFLVGGTALALGRGEHIQPLADQRRRAVVLVFPPFGVSTADAYRWLDVFRRKTGTVRAPAAPPAGAGTRAVLRNDFEGPVIARHPEIGAIKRRLRRLGAEAAAMSGSGSTVFGLFSTVRAADAAVRRIEAAGLRAVRARFLPGRHA